MNSNLRIQGMTVLELLIMFGFLVLLAAFVAPVISRTSAETDMNTAKANLESSIDLARQTAQVFKTRVVLHLRTDNNTSDSLSLTMPSLSQSALQESWDFLEAETKEYDFPKSIHLVTDQDAIQFDERGQVAIPVHLILVSHADSDLVEHVLLE